MANVNEMFEITKNKYNGYFNPDDCPVDRYKPWIQFLNEHSLVSYAITESPPLITEPLRLMCTTATVAKNKRSFSFVIQGTTYTCTSRTISEALHLPLDNLEPLPSVNDLIQFFTDLHYQSNINLTKMFKTNLVREWDLIFDTLAKVFSNCTQNSFQNIPSILQHIAYAITYNRRIDIGSLIFNIL